MQIKKSSFPSCYFNVTFLEKNISLSLLDTKEQIQVRAQYKIKEVTEVGINFDTRRGRYLSHFTYRIQNDDMNIYVRRRNSCIWAWFFVLKLVKQI